MNTLDNSSTTEYKRAGNEPAGSPTLSATLYPNAPSSYTQEQLKYSELLAEPDLDYDAPYDDQELEKLRLLHLNCSTYWLGQHGTNKITGETKLNITQNHCNDRSCPVCTKHRIGMELKEISVRLSFISSPKHTVLTRKNCVLTKRELISFRRDIKRYNRSVSNYFKNPSNKYRKLFVPGDLKSYQYFGLYVIEYKRDRETGLYHVHAHLASNITPPQKTICKIWSDILGYDSHPYVKYHSGRKNLIHYFARRAALAGFGMTPGDYLQFCKRSRVVNCFGYVHLPRPAACKYEKPGSNFYYLLTALETHIEHGHHHTAFSSYVLDVLATAEQKFTWRTFYRLKKGQATSKPPDFLTPEFLQELLDNDETLLMTGAELNSRHAQEDYELRTWNMHNNPDVIANIEKERNGR